MPLNRAWDGPRALQGVTAYRLGATGDLRVLWREVCQRGVVKDMCAVAAAATAAAGAAGAAASGPLAAASGIHAVVAALGGETAFREAPEFPPDHAALRVALKHAGLAELNPVDAATLTGTGFIAPAPKNRERKLRRLNRRNLIVTGLEHLPEEQRKAMLLARVQVLRASDSQASHGGR